MYADFGAVVAAQHRTVVDQRDPASQPRGRHRGTHPGDAAAHHDEIERLHALRRIGNMQHPAAESRQLPGIGRRHIPLIPGEIDGVAAAVEAGKVGQRNFDRTLPDSDPSGILPHPLPAPVSQHLGQRPFPHPEGESPGALAVVPGSDPVERPHVGVISPGFGEFDGRNGVRHGFAHAVCDEIRRSHQIHELLIDGPAALVAETLGLDPNAGPESRRRGEQQRGGKQNNPFHNLPGTNGSERRAV